MREPRPRQRLPEGGLDIYEKLKTGTWTSPKLLMVYTTDYVDLDGKPISRKALESGYVLRMNSHFDPLLYFWPVEDFLVIAFVNYIDSDFSQKLVRALLRDGAEYANLACRSRLSTHNRSYYKDGGYKKPSAEWTYELTEQDVKRRLFQ